MNHEGPLDEPLSALDLKLRTDMQYELRELQQRLGITFVFVTTTKKKPAMRTGSLSRMKERSSNLVHQWYLWWTDQPLCSYPYRGVQHPRWSYDRGLPWLSSMANAEAVDGGCVQTNQLKSSFVLKTCKSPLPEEGKLQVKVDTHSSVVCMRSSLMMIWEMSGWSIHRKAIVEKSSG